MTDGVTLSSILGGQVSIQWYEAVALVREVSDRLLNGSSERAIPELQQIRLSPEGHVEILGVIPTNEPVRRMGQLLQALLAHADAPVQLRLIITQATAPVPPYQSIRDYSDALGFFERPERSTVLQSLASRVTAASAIEVGRPLTLDSIAPLPAKPKAEEQKAATRDQRSRSRPWAFALVAVVILGISAAGFWYARKQGIGPKNREEATALADKASNAVGSAILSGASAVTETLGLGRIVPANEATSPAAPVLDATAPPTTTRKPSQPKHGDTPTGTAPSPALIAFDLEPAPSPTPVSPGSPPPIATSDSIVGVPQSQGNETIYSVDTPSIVPPVGIRPKLARQLPPDFDPARLGRVELIIGPDGSVESAKLLGPPRTVNDGLFLSVAKAWTFQPALRGGVPVRYRKTIWVASP